MITKLWIAANVVDIPFTETPTLFAHLQVVAEDNNGNLFEIEVEPNWTLSHWIVDGADGDKDHISGTRYSSDTTGTFYKKTELTQQILHGRNPEDVWEILKQAAQHIKTIQESIEYDFEVQNSNSFVKTLLSMVGIDVENHVSSITPSYAELGFPAVSRNINLFDTPVVNYQLEGTAGRDIIKTGIGNDFLFGGLNDDTDTPLLEGDGVSDRLYGDLGTDEYRMFDLRTIDYDDPLSIGAAIEVCDYISDYDENGFVTILNPNGFVTRLANYTFRPGDGEPGVVWIGENPHAQPIRIMLLRAETETQEGIWGVVNHDNQVMFLLPDGALPPQPEQLLFGGPEMHLTGQNMPSSFLGFRFPELMNQITGTGGADSLAGTTEDDYMLPGAGNDTVAADDGNDVVRGGNGNDSLTGGDGYDDLQGEAGNDFLSGEDGDDDLLGGDGSDTIHGGAGDDLIGGGEGADVAHGGDGDDRILEQFSTIAGNNDSFDGGAGDDFLSAGSGKDTLTGGAGPTFSMAKGVSTWPITAARRVRSPSILRHSPGQAARRKAIRSFPSRTSPGPASPTRSPAAARARIRLPAALPTIRWMAAAATTRWRAGQATTAISSMPARMSSARAAGKETTASRRAPTMCWERTSRPSR